ncbi:MAG: hypothetical protein PVH79_03185 [Candidatus Bathyarchaeota archaeon]|jgi:ketosteroid isomerase-like protein
MNEGKNFNHSLVEDWVSIWNNYNLSEVRKLFIDDERVTYFSSEKEGVIKGIEALVNHHREFGFVPGGKEQSNKLWLEEIDIESYKECAIVTAIWCFRRGGSDKIQRGPVTLVYFRANGGYKIAHANFSNY